MTSKNFKQLLAKGGTAAGVGIAATGLSAVLASGMAHADDVVTPDVPGLPGVPVPAVDLPDYPGTPPVNTPPVDLPDVPAVPGVAIPDVNLPALPAVPSIDVSVG